MNECSKLMHPLSKFVLLSRLRIVPTLSILENDDFNCDGGKKAQGLNDVSKLSLCTSVRVPITSCFIGNSLGEFSITRQFKWME